MTKPNKGQHVGIRFSGSAAACWLVVGFFSLLCIQPSGAGESAWVNSMDNQLGGHFKLEGGVTGYDAGSYFEPTGTHTGKDGLVGARLTDTLVLSDTVYVEAHYEAFLKWGDTYEKRYDLQQYGPLPVAGLVQDPSAMDNRRLFDLTKTIEKTDDDIAWHRLDRLFFSIKLSRGDIRVGRQAVTWGNGFMFNPMDLFNPFAPSDTVRDYKMGDDLVLVRWDTERFGEADLLYVPRRNATGDIDFQSASMAGKLHFFAEDIEMDIMGAWHYDEAVLGLGVTGYLGDAAWRTDVVWSTLKTANNDNGYVAVVANIDTSWVWFNKNLYGLIEYYHNGLGKHHYTDALGDPDVMERIDRGELFVLGKHYLGGRIQVELHPLLNVYLSVINNVTDPSGIVQPWAVWNVTQNSTLHFGATLFYGKKGSEYGGYLIPGTSYYTNAAPNAFVQFTYYF
ncbi:hypothetical protein [Desulfobacula sp.]|uniref:hypothetical protein n=1 Tax=Desulfobacula sp. TaxID=2593537 RepID=UPI002624FA5F|nr:hypothetical protein [Desulfobacula sp.]